jgi:hypothetical protein
MGIYILMKRAKIEKSNFSMLGIPLFREMGIG